MISVPGLDLLSRRHDVCGLLCAPDRPAGRGRKLHAPPAKELALELGIPVLQPERLGPEAREAVRRLGAELLVVFAYGRIFGPKFLALFPRGGINCHPSLLPRYRGPSPIPAALLAGDEFTGLSVQTLSLQMDAGDLLLTRTRQILPEDSTESLSAWAAEEGAQALAAAVDTIAEGNTEPLPQRSEGLSYCRFLRKEDSWISWDMPAHLIARQVAAYHPWPGSTAMLGSEVIRLRGAEVVPAPPDGGWLASGARPGAVVSVDSAGRLLIQTTAGLLGIRFLQRQQRRELAAPDFVRGYPAIVGSTLHRPDGEAL